MWEAAGRLRGVQQDRGAVLPGMLGQGVHATAVRLDKRTRLPIRDPVLGEAYHVVLNFGIIDILQVRICVLKK